MLTQYREHVGAAVEQEERRVRLVAGDCTILRLLAEFVHLQRSHVSALTRRGRKIVERRLRALEEMEYARPLALPDDRWGERAWFLTPKGWNFAWEEGWTERRIEGTLEKSSKNLRHDLEITQLHFAIRDAFADGLTFWNQHYHRIHHRWGRGEYDVVNPDAFFVLSGEKDHPFFFENAKVREFSYRDGESALERKMRGYAEYADEAFKEKWDFDNFRVLVFFPTAERAANFREKMRKAGGALSTKRFFFGAWENFDSKKIWLLNARDESVSYLSDIVGRGTNR